ncbi:temptin-like [Ostrea edulis]|uniref:temptin-like n=1 Tax=Ostrea edulis TaxID=37623 RepID=UPI002095D1A0|nr:temptin-like [Ostrea edulis]
MRSLFLVPLLFVSALAHAGFRLMIPNGINVPNPCTNVFGLWNAVGHNIEIGGGAANVFGADFVTANTKWTKDLCQKDSDMDGKTNGEELGDPNCVWTAGATPAGDATGHPGICEPMSSANCMKINVNITCI